MLSNRGNGGGSPGKPPLSPLSPSRKLPTSGAHAVHSPTSNSSNSQERSPFNSNNLYSNQFHSTCTSERANRARTLSDKCENVDVLVHSIAQQRRKSVDAIEQKNYMESVEAGKALHVACWSDAPLETVLAIIQKNPEAINYEDDEGRTPVEICKSKKCCCFCCCCNRNRKKVIIALEKGEQYYQKVHDSTKLPLLPRLHSSSEEYTKYEKVGDRDDSLLPTLLLERERIYRNVADKLKMIDDEKLAIHREIESLEASRNKKKTEISKIQEKMTRSEKSTKWFKSTRRSRDARDAYKLGVIKLDLHTIEQDLEEMREAAFLVDTKHNQLIRANFAHIDRQIEQVTAMKKHWNEKLNRNDWKNKVE